MGRHERQNELNRTFNFSDTLKQALPIDRCLSVYDTRSKNPFLPVLIDFHLQLSYFPHNTPVLLPHLIKLHYNLLVV